MTSRRSRAAAACASAGSSRASDASAAIAASVAPAPMRQPLPSRRIASKPAIEDTSTSAAGEPMPRRRFGTRSVPPATIRAPGICASSAAACVADTARYSVNGASVGISGSRCPPTHRQACTCARKSPALRADCARACSAPSRRSGATGSSRRRSPVASAIALVSAGRKPASEPSAASFAPNGPFGSGASTMKVSIGGDSTIVGTR